jgi:hypothetical protein
MICTAFRSSGITGSLLILIRPRALVGVVPSDEAASGRTQGAMVTRVVARCTASDGSLDAPFGRRGDGQCCERKNCGSEYGRDVLTRKFSPN